MMRLLKRGLLFVLLIELGYLLIFNLALNLNLTQDLVNRIKPDKFQLGWESAWTPWPFRVYARGIASNGQAKSQQWELRAPKASASIAVLPLLDKRVSLAGVTASDVTYYQRPRPKPDKDYSSVRAYFPPIAGRPLETSPPPPPAGVKNRKPWRIQLRDLEVSGTHELWLYQLRARFAGQANTDLSIETRGGPISISHGNVDLQIDSIDLNDTPAIASNGTLRGTITLHPLRIRENRGLRALPFLELDLELNAQAESLRFLNFYLRAFEGMQLDGQGSVDGHIRLANNRLLPGSRLQVSADRLQMEMLDYRVEGDGNVQLDTAGEAQETRFVVAFNDLNAYYADLDTPLLSGNGLVISGSGGNQLFRAGQKRTEAKQLALSIDTLQVPDLALYQRYLPQQWKLQLQGGEGQLSGRFAVSQQQLHSDFSLRSNEASIAIQDYSFTSDLDVSLQIDAPDLSSGKLDISGTYFKLGETQVSREETDSAPWYAEIEIDQGLIRLPMQATDPSLSGAQRVLQLFRNKEVGELLASTEETARISGRISDLAWLNLVLKNPYKLQIHGRGGIESELKLKQGWLETGSRVNIVPQQLAVDFLDYQADGDGRLELEVTRGGPNPDIALAIDLEDAQLRRQQSSATMVDELELDIRAIARAVSLDQQERSMQLQLQIPTARVADMSAYNELLPESSPLQILGGEAALSADIQLEPEDAKGYLRLDTRGMRARVDEQEVAARLRADINLKDGIPRQMAFDISGSSLRLDEVSILGQKQAFLKEDWAADLRFKQADAIWLQPVQLNVTADISMTNSIPLVSMLANHRDKHGWLEEALTVDDVEGSLTLRLANQRITIPSAFVSSDNIDVGAKAVISADRRDGRVFVRYKALKGLLKIENGERNIDIIGTEKKFREYSTESGSATGEPGRSPTEQSAL